MHIESVPAEIRKLLTERKMEGLSIGFVPTMGALHEGHLNLVRKSKSENLITVVSIFVNPIQFNKQEDLDNYPRTLESDIEKLAGLGVDYLFTPEEKDLYPTMPSVSLHFGQMAEVMEGRSRPGHFDGVGIVVSKFFHIIQPDHAYFGLKDLQQFLLIKRMCHDLDFPVEVHGVETVRHESGLAMSSRNKRLSKDGLKIAATIHKGLKRIENGIKERIEVDQILRSTSNYFDSVEGLEIEYLEVVNAENLESVNSYEKINELAVCVAGYVEGVRLIDNLYLRLK